MKGSGAIAPGSAYEEGRGWGFEIGPGLAFSLRVAPGNYLLSLGFGRELDGAKPSGLYAAASALAERGSASGGAPGGTSARGEVAAAMFTEGRRLAMADLPRPCDRVVIALNVRDIALKSPPPNAPGSDRVMLYPDEEGQRAWDGKLTIEAAGAMPWPESMAIEAAPAMPTLFLAGDSTVGDCESGPYASWGQILPLLLRPSISVANYARGGATLKSFMAELRLAKILECMKSGDWLLIQFGHNDQKAEWPQTHADPARTFPAYLRTFIEEARLRGATPILATSPERLRFGADGRIAPSHGAYPEAVRSLARAEALALVDLERSSRLLYEALGPEEALRLLAKPGAGDLTHHGPYGAYEMARCVARDLGRSCPGLAEFLKPGFADFDPEKPDPSPAFSRAWEDRAVGA